MGGKSKKQTIGYKYYLGQHHVLCHGPIDNVSRISVDERLAWAGVSAGGTISVSKPDLFGGDKREGGVSGLVDIAMGGPTQGQNSYLVSQLGADVPGYRGVVSAILRQCYLGNNPYLKPWRYRGQRVYLSQGGTEQWYKGKAGIGTAWDGPQAIYIALDVSASMSTVTGNGLTRLANAKLAIANLIDFIKNTLQQSEYSLDIIGVAWGGTATSQQYLNATPANLDSLKSWFNGRTTVSATDFQVAVAGAPAFFAAASASANRSVLFITDGEPNDPGTATTAASTLSGISGLTTYAFNIDLEDTSYTELLDNSPGDGVPVVDGSDPNSLLGSLAPTLGGVLDMNGAHIIRECLVDPDWGMGYQESDIDDVSFEAAADRIFSEGLGTSLLWDRQILIDDFIQEVVKHIDAALYVDRKTGKFTLKLIRDDYDPETLLVFDESNISKVSNPAKSTFGELVNSVTVNYWDARTGKDASVTITDPAMVQMQGAVINTTLQYPGFTTPRNATIAGQRDLRVLSSPFLSCTIYTDSTAKDLNIGDTFKFRWSRWQIDEMVMRVTGIAFGDSKSSQVRITCTQDVYSTPTVSVVTPGGSEWIDPSAPPSAATFQLAVEAPYYEIVQTLGQADADNKLASHPEIGYILAATSRAPSAINTRMWVDDGTGYVDTGTVDFSPYAELSATISKTQTSFILTNMDDQDEIEIGSHFQIDDELMRIDSIDTVTGDVTVGRGVLDTVPAEHSAGAAVLFWDLFAGFDPTEYVDGETVDVKVTAVSGAGEQTLASVPTISVELDQRAARPYPPGDFQINGESYAANPLYLGTVSVSWVHRDRLQQTSGTLIDHTSGSIGPEVGTVYRLRGYIDDVLDHEEDDISGTSASWSPSTQSENCRVEVHAKRDGIYSWQAPSHSFSNASSGPVLTEESDDRYTETGDQRYTE